MTLSVIFCLIFCFTSAPCVSAQLNEDIAKYEAFKKFGNYDDVKQILQQLRSKSQLSHPNVNQMDDETLSSGEKDEKSFGQSEIYQNRKFLEDVYEGDIILTLPQAKKILQDFTSNKRKKRKIIRDRFSLWPTTTISYHIDHSISSDKRPFVMAGIKHWEDNTCLNFKEKNSDDYVSFVDGAGCYSNVGRQGGKQEISLSDGCESLGVVAHEIGHILGFWHEHSRPDRDSYIKINLHNVDPSRVGNFERVPTGYVNDYGVPYDLGSALHYGPKAFTSRSFRRTIDTIDPNFSNTIGQRASLSFIDIKQINKAYCSDICKNDLLCKHGGYPDPSVGGSRCNKCKCPEGLSGKFCEKVQESKNSSCSIELSAVSEWQQINATGNDKVCYWFIKAPGNTRITLEVTKLDMICRDTCINYLEINYNKNFEQTGSRLCCDLPKVPMVSLTNEMIIIYHVGYQENSTSYFSARYKTSFGKDSSAIEPTVIIIETPETNLGQPDKLLNTSFSLPSFWGQWEDWSTCSEKCGGCGKRQRKRICLGSACPGDNMQNIPCNSRVCESNNNFTCTFSIQVSCNDGNETSDILKMWTSRKPPDYTEGQITVGPLKRYDGQNGKVRLKRQSSTNNLPTRDTAKCTRNLQYNCVKNSKWKTEGNDACCKGFEKRGNFCVY